MVTHEIGHALGHEGHTRKNSIMTTYLEEAADEKIYTPTSDDLQQMLQVY
ncbi:MAG: matrixin family metalloprotease [Ruminococcaceae bacterium]|nr:matrixin family metalloprotease [Oscillospiraceae bacterium]